MEKTQVYLRKEELAALRAELELLDRAIEQQYPFPEDLALARIPDPQGMGGSSRSQSAGR